VTYSNESKVKTARRPRRDAETFGAVSEETALEMAEGARRVTGADFALSVTGVAGPSGGTAQKPVGLVFIGLAGPDVSKVFRTNFPGSRGDIRERSANQALDVLRRRLLAESVKPPTKGKRK